MKLKNTLKAVLAAVLCWGMMAGCANSGSVSDSTPDTSSVSDTSAPEDTSAPDETPAPEDTSSAPVESEPEKEISYPEEIRVVALKGPTAMGMVKMMANNELADRPYSVNYTITGAVDEVAPMVIKGEADIICAPANLTSVLYNKTEGGVKAMAINTMGILYICENGSTVSSVADLKGKTIYASGKAATPEYALNYILSENGIDPEKDVNIEWKSEHSECLAALLADESGVAMLPQPFVTTALMKNEGVNVVIDLNKEWAALESSSAMITGAVMVRTEFAEKYPEVLAEFLKEYKASVDYVNANIPEAAQLIEQYDIVPAAVAEKAIPNCNIVCITGEEMKEKLGGYLEVLFAQFPGAVGGALPADDFYFIAE